jgi:dihydroxy-acid dehydratase
MREPRNSGSQFAERGLSGTIARMFMRGAGLSAESLQRRPVIGICSSWSELNPCNLGLKALGEAVRRGIVTAGGIAFEFPTISLHEAYARPSSFLFRNLMAMDVEEMISASPIDGVVLLNGCDKTVPAQLMGALSADKPALSLAAGPRQTGTWRGQLITIDDLWSVDDRRRTGELGEDDVAEFEGVVNPGIGTCNVLGTASTMAIVAEALGLSLPGSALLPATSSARAATAEETGHAIVELARRGVAPSSIVDAAALENAFRVVCAVGGSTNAVIHLHAIAGRVGIDLPPELLREWSASTPLLARVKPNGPALLADLDAAGGVPALLRELGPVASLDARAGDGRPWRDVVVTTPTWEQSAIRPWDDPFSPGGESLVILDGTLAPGGALLKASAASPSLLHHRGRAVVFDGAADVAARIDDPALDVDETSVIVLRGLGPLGGPGMPEVGVPIPARLLREGVTDMLRVTDGRISGTAGGTVVLHVAPEGAVEGPLSLVEDGDIIELDARAGRLDLCVESEVLARRTPAPRASLSARGYERLYHEHVLQASEGCDFDFLRAVPERVGVEA